MTDQLTKTKPIAKRIHITQLGIPKLVREIMSREPNALLRGSQALTRTPMLALLTTPTALRNLSGTHRLSALPMFCLMEKKGGGEANHNSSKTINN